MVPVTEQPVRYEVVDGVAWLTINPPETRNALNEPGRPGGTRGLPRQASPGVEGMLMSATNQRAGTAGADHIATAPGGRP